MKRLSDEEKAGLQARIEQERAERTQRIAKRYKHERPPSASFGRIVGEFLAGGVVGTAGAVIPFLILSTGGGEDWGGFFALVCVTPITYPLASAVPVYLVGSIGKKTGSFSSAAAFVGSVLGAFLGFFLGWGFVLMNLQLKNSGFGDFGDWGLFTTILILLAAPGGATIGFNLGRRWYK